MVFPSFAKIVLDEETGQHAASGSAIDGRADDNAGLPSSQLERCYARNPGVKFGLLFPVKLQMTHNGSERLSTNPEESRQLSSADNVINTQCMLGREGNSGLNTG